MAAAPQNGVGIVGVWPGARVLNVPLPVQNTPQGGKISCKASGDGIERAVEAGAAVINMSYGSTSRCASEWVQIYFAVAKGIIAVAAAGNEFPTGNPLEFPASLPHVVTVAATTPDDSSAWFSNVNDAIDLSAPGEGILTAVPKTFDTTGQDGYESLDGTSFAAPMVAAALAWVRAARPELKPDQVVQAVRLDGARRPAARLGPADRVRDPERRRRAVGGRRAAAARRIRSSPTTTSRGWTGGCWRAPQPVWSGSGIKRVNATLDKQEDNDRRLPGRDPGAAARRGSPSSRASATRRSTCSPSGAFSVNDLEARVSRARAGPAASGPSRSRSSTPAPPRGRTTCRSRRRAPRATRSASTPSGWADPACRCR